MLCKCIIADKTFEVLIKIYKIQFGSTITIGINKNLLSIKFVWVRVRGSVMVLSSSTQTIESFLNSLYWKI